MGCPQPCRERVQRSSKAFSSSGSSHLTIISLPGGGTATD